MMLQLSLKSNYFGVRKDNFGLENISTFVVDLKQKQNLVAVTLFT